MKMVTIIGLTSTDVVKFSACDDTPIHDDVNEVPIIVSL